MNWIASIFISILSGALGLFCAGVVASACVKWYRISSFEGGSGYFVVFNALFGGIAGLVIGLVAARLVAASASPSFLKGLGCAWGSVVGIAGLVALVSYVLADIPPTIQGRPLTLEVEVRLPVNVTNSPAGGTGESYLDLHSVVGHTARKTKRGELKPAEARLESGRWIVPGEVPVFTTRGRRSLSFQLHGQEVQGFMVPLPARPGKEYENWSDWMPHPIPPNPPWPDTKPSYRFRVQRVPLPPPPRSAAEVEAEAAAKEEAEFRAVPADAPIQDWFPYTRYGAKDERRAIAIKNITSKPDYVAELAALMVSDNEETAAGALYLVPHLPQHPPELLAAVTATGRHLVDLVRKVNATTPDQDPGYLGAAGVSIRFSAWMEAVRALREKAGGDFTPELREILQLSRVRTDSYVMQQDVRRVASYYAHQWAGLAPEPGDPPPR